MSDKFVTIMKSLYSTQYYTFYANVILKKPLLAFSENQLYHTLINDCHAFWNFGWQLINSKPTMDNSSVPEFWLKHYADMLL